uniref:serine/threonine-protein kinase n=1 Tax=Prosthecobacter sp. TaxID=1965333 RepID=UPI0037836FD5
MSDPATPTPRTTGGNVRWEPPSAADLQAQMPGYTIEKLLGRGGMGAVYRGVQSSLDRPVAIKVLPPGVEQEDPSFAERFKNEARLMARLNNPAVVSVHDFGLTTGGLLYFAMEYVDGTDVSQMIRSQGKLPPDHALAITAHVCDALSAAHELGIVHRDIKPANVLINMKGQVKVADFGLAKIEEPGTHGLTKTGYAMGTPDFVAPEVLMLGSHIDGRADLYAVGVMLYQMLTGEVPRGAFKPATARLPGLDPRFDPIILKAMQSDREERYQSSTELRRDLDVILTVPLVRQDEPPAAAQAAAQTPPARLGPRHEGGMPVRKQPPSSQPGPTYLDDGPAGQASPVRAVVKKPKSQAPLLLLGAAAVVAAGAYVVFSSGGPGEVRHPETASPSVSAPTPAKQSVNNMGQSKAAGSTASQSQTKPAITTPAALKPAIAAQAAAPVPKAVETVAAPAAPPPASPAPSAPVSQSPSLPVSRSLLLHLLPPPWLSPLPPANSTNASPRSMPASRPLWSGMPMPRSRPAWPRWTRATLVRLSASSPPLPKAGSWRKPWLCGRRSSASRKARACPPRWTRARRPPARYRTRSRPCARPTAAPPPSTRPRRPRPCSRSTTSTTKPLPPCRPS